MEKQFVTYEIALALKELGFDEECLAYYAKPTTKEDIELFFTSGVYGWVKQNNTILQKCTTPLWQQAIDWFREKYKLHINILGDGFNGEFKGYYYSITEEGWINWYESIDSGKWYDDYKECQKQAILKAIELCKNN